MIGILDYGMGNIGSVSNMLRYIGCQSVVIKDANQLKNIDKLILPGVGRFDAAMEKINELPGMIDALNLLALEKKIPILGVCLGMQILTDFSEEGQVDGLGWINGKACKFPSFQEIKVPHMGWNTAKPLLKNALTEGLTDNERYYFVHSYYVKVHEESTRLMTTNHGIDFDSGIVNKYGNIYGLQFHPEKSHKFGMQIFKNFVAL